MEHTPSERDQARNLYFQLGLTQTQIAGLIGVSQKTVSLWAAEGRWKNLKSTVEQTPAVLMEDMYSELAELNDSIRSREPGKRFATAQEAEIRRKLLASVKFLGDKQSAGTHAEVLMNFCNFFQQNATQEQLKFLVDIADVYLKGEKKLGQKGARKPYTLPERETAEEEETPTGKIIPFTPVAESDAIASDSPNAEVPPAATDLPPSNTARPLRQWPANQPGKRKYSQQYTHLGWDEWQRIEDARLQEIAEREEGILPPLPGPAPDYTIPDDLSMYFRNRVCPPTMDTPSGHAEWERLLELYKIK